MSRPVLRSLLLTSSFLTLPVLLAPTIAAADCDLNGGVIECSGTIITPYTHTGPANVTVLSGTDMSASGLHTLDIDAFNIVFTNNGLVRNGTQDSTTVRTASLSDIYNNGTIENTGANGTALNMTDGNLYNSGTIRSNNSALVLADAWTIRNSGNIVQTGATSTAPAILINSTDEFINEETGVITAAGGTAIAYGNETGYTNHLQNDGRITGNIIFNNDDSRYYSEGGTLTGNLIFGDGDDRLSLDQDAVITGVVDFGAGNDYVDITINGDYRTNFSQFLNLEGADLYLESAGTITIDHSDRPIQFYVMVENDSNTTTGRTFINNADFDGTEDNRYFALRAEYFEKAINNGVIRFTGDGTAFVSDETEYTTNNGSILAFGEESYAIDLYDIKQFENNGVITAGYNTIYLSNDDIRARVINRGTIALNDSSTEEDRSAFWIYGDFDLINERTGVIDGNGGLAIYANDPTSSSVINNGLIRGDIVFEEGSNVYASAGGRLEGGITFGDGDDTVLLDVNAVITGLIDGGAGIDSVTVSGNGDYLLSASQYRNVENFTRDGLGILTISGNMTFTNFVTSGQVNLQDGASLSLAHYDIQNQGSLTLNGSFTGDIGVASGGLLKGSGVLNGNLTNNGRLAPGNSPGRINVVGNYTQSASGTLDVEIGVPATGAPVAGVNYDQLAVTGSATLAGALKLDIAPGVYNGTTFDIITATGGITGNFANLSDMASGTFLNLGFNLASDAAVSATANNVYRLTVTRKAYNTAAVTANEIATADAFTSALTDPAASAAMNNFLGRLNMTSAGDARKLFNAANGEIYGALLTAAQDMGGRFGNAIQDAARSPQSGVWVRANKLWGNGRGNGNAHGVDQDHDSIATGFDVAIDDAIRLGVAVTSGSASSMLASGTASAKSDGWAVAAYASLRQGPWGFSALYSHGRTKHDVTRQLPGLGLTAKGKTRGDSNVAALEGFYQIAAGRLSATPFAGLSYNNVDFDHVRESGAGALDLTVLAGGAKAIKGYAGGEGRVDIALSSLTLTPFARLVYAHDFATNGRGIAQSFAGGGGRFTVDGRAPGRDSLTVGAGLDLTVSNGLSLRVSYDGEWRSDTQSNGLTGTMRIAF